MVTSLIRMPMRCSNTKTASADGPTMRCTGHHSWDYLFLIGRLCVRVSQVNLAVRLLYQNRFCSAGLWGSRNDTNQTYHPQCLLFCDLPAGMEAADQHRSAARRTHTQGMELVPDADTGPPMGNTRVRGGPACLGPRPGSSSSRSKKSANKSRRCGRYSWD